MKAHGGELQEAKDRTSPLLLSTIDGFSKRNHAAKAAFSMLEALVARLENLVEDELNGGKLSPFTVRCTEPSQCVARLHLALVLRRFDDIVIRSIRVRHTETSVDRVE